MKYTLRSQKNAIDMVLKVDPSELLPFVPPVSPMRLAVCPLRGFTAGVATICTLVTSACSGSTNPAADLTLSKVLLPMAGALSESETIRTQIEAKSTVYRILMRKSSAKKYAYQTNLIGFSYFEPASQQSDTSRICLNAHRHIPVPIIDQIYILICKPDICAPANVRVFSTPSCTGEQ